MAGRGQPPLSVRMELWRQYQAGQLSANQIRNLEMDVNDRSEIVDDQGRPASSSEFENGVSTNTATYISPWIRWGARRGIGGLTEDFTTMKAATEELVQVGQYFYIPAAALADPLGYGLPASVVTSYMQRNPGATAAQAAEALLPAQSINTILGRPDDDGAGAVAGSVLQTLGGAVPSYTTTSLPLGAMSTLQPAAGAGLSPMMLLAIGAAAFLLLRR